MTTGTRSGGSAWRPGLRLVIKALAFLCMGWVLVLAWNVHRVLQEAAVSDTAARGFGPRMVQVMDSFAYDIPQPAPDRDLSWRVLTGTTFSQPTRRGWTETVLRLAPTGREETVVRVSLASTGMDPDLAVDGDLASQLTFLSRRIVALKSDATLRMQLPTGSWVEFSSPAHWRDRPTDVQLGLLVLTALGLLAALVSWAANRLSARFERLAAHAADLLEHRTTEPMPVAGTAEARKLALALNGIQGDLGRQVQDRTRFLAAISHDLRTPTTRMKLRAELIDDEALRAKMLSDLDEIGSMVGAALDYLRDGLDETEPETILFGSLMQSLCDDYVDIGKPVTLSLPEPLVATAQGTLFDPRTSQFDVKFDRHITLTCQPGRLRRAFGNIIDNALKYGDWARVVIEADASEIRVRVIDGGPGIPADQSALVFEPFYRVEGSRSRATGGVGLGLSVSRSIIEAHGGSIVLFNHDRHGLEVRVVLPRTP